MIPYIGIDAVEIARFYHIHRYHYRQLARIFTPEEIAYCCSNPQLRSARFATRFAAKEALYKAISQYTQPPAFLSLCRNTYVITLPAPHLHIAHDLHISSSLSLSHTNTTAVAVVLIHPIT